MEDSSWRGIKGPCYREEEEFLLQKLVRVLIVRKGRVLIGEDLENPFFKDRM